MASSQVTLVGVAYTDKTGNPPIHLTIVAEMYSTGLSVGGGPMPGGPPLGIWGGGGVGNYPDAGFPGPQPGQPPRPWGPINYPDQGLPGDQPGIWGPNDPRPGTGLPGPQPTPGWPPIAMPPIFYPPTQPPAGSAGDDGFTKPPPEGGGWAYHETYGWLFSPSGAGPKSSP